MITAVIFDYGNVISQLQSGNCYAQMEKRCGVPAQVFSSSFYKFRVQFDLGEISGAQLYSLILKDNGFTALAKDQTLCAELARFDMDSWSTINKPANDWALELQKSGYKLGVLSNMPYEFLDMYEKDIPVFTHADVAIFSCRVKLIKPNPLIYKTVLDQLAVPAHEAVFFDDIAENIEAAKKVGLNAILWKNFEQARQEFQTLIAP